jgi:simple sugar transport system ATP-binding protein
LILDEPTAALGVKQAGVVLRYIAQARGRNLGVIFITHNPHHAYAVGDKFTILKRGRTVGTFTKNELKHEEMVRMMSGVDELDALSHELEEFARADAQSADGVLSAVEEQLAHSLEEGEELFTHQSEE